MNKITVNKNELLSMLGSNREKHTEEFNRATTGYLDQMKELLGDLLKAADSGNFDLTCRLKSKVTRMPVPEQHIKEYDQAIKMLKMHQEDVVDLEQYEFAQLVEDEWGWKEKFSVTNSFYVR